MSCLGRDSWVWLGIVSWVISVSETGSPLTSGVLQHCLIFHPIPLFPSYHGINTDISSWISAKQKTKQHFDPWVVAPVLICYYAWSSSHLFGWLTTQCVLWSAGSVCRVLLPSGDWWKEFSSETNQEKHHASCFSFFFTWLIVRTAFLWSLTGFCIQLHFALFRSSNLALDPKWNHPTWSPPVP